LTDLADALGVGPRHLTRLFVQHCGAPPGAVARTRRIQRAKLLLDGTTLKITDIALAAGFGSVRSFNAAFRAVYHRSPSELRPRRHGVIGLTPRRAGVGAAGSAGQIAVQSLGENSPTGYP
jgi:AraC family transcriptional regulator of adaptative response / DNA-3-methyladenine glycosylase II